MSVILRPRTTAYPLTGLSTRSRSGRGLASALTGAAVVLTLILAAVIPAKADHLPESFNESGAITGFLGT